MHITSHCVELFLTGLLYIHRSEASNNEWKFSMSVDGRRMRNMVPTKRRFLIPVIFPRLPQF